MILCLGKMRTEELAKWFGITYSTFRKYSKKYYEKLEDYCVYEKVYGAVVIKEIHLDTYDKDLDKKAQRLYLKEISRCLAEQDGLSTLSGMARKFVQEGEYDNIKTAERHVAKAGKILFGETKDLSSRGEAGTREFLWAIKVDDMNHYRLMTEEENKRFNEIISICYAENPEKVKKAALLEESLRKNKISSQEYFEIKDRLGLDTFKDCIFKFLDETGNLIVRCTQHEIDASFEYFKNKNNILNK